jgi:two-component system copper resistance phosphate regulon response regulator CusR
MPSVLVVEDEPALSDTLAKALAEEGFLVDTALDGHEGLFKMSEDCHDVVLLDIMLPGLDGWTLLENARARGVDAAILILTARETVEDRVRGLTLGADDYLAKPFALAELIARVHALARRAGKARLQRQQLLEGMNL